MDGGAGAGGEAVKGLTVKTRDTGYVLIRSWKTKGWLWNLDDTWSFFPTIFSPLLFALFAVALFTFSHFKDKVQSKLSYLFFFPSVRCWKRGDESRLLHWDELGLWCYFTGLDFISGMHYSIQIQCLLLWQKCDLCSCDLFKWWRLCLVLHRIVFLNPHCHILYKIVCFAEW